VLSVHALVVRLGGLSILRSLSLEIPTGSIVGLVGRNGAGKTTTLRSIMGLVPVESGNVVLDNRDLVRLPPFERGRLGIGYMPEDRRLIGSLTVKDNLRVPAWGQGRRDADERWDAVAALLPEVAALARRQASQLSGGQQKLVALGRALFCAYRLLLLDEPMEGVSPALSARMAEVVRAFQATKPGLAVLMAESDVNRVRLLTERIATIERGEVVPTG
jgi:ABC-type branched-subunit amino acid transport system ATPase component